MTSTVSNSCLPSLGWSFFSKKTESKHPLEKTFSLAFADTMSYQLDYRIPFACLEYFYDIPNRKPVIILDNHTSMSSKKTAKAWISPTRWQEARGSAQALVKSARLFHDSVLLYFSGVEHGEASAILLKEASDVASVFQKKIESKTAVFERLKQVVNHPELEDESLSILVMTSQIPSDCSEYELQIFLQNMNSDALYKERIAINFIVDSDDERVFEFYQRVTQGVSISSVSLDYTREKERLRSIDSSFELTPEAYSVKQLLHMFKNMDKDDTRYVDSSQGNEEGNYKIVSYQSVSQARTHSSCLPTGLFFKN